MNAKRKLALATGLAASLASVGCHRSISDGTASIATEARQKIAEQNLSLGNEGSTLPKAELTPQGDLLIAGQKVVVTAEQHALLLKHRQLLEQVASDGVAVGMQGVDLAGKAVSNALSGIFSGNSTDTKARIESEAGKIKASARQLCDELPALYASQQAAAESVPEFRPYAKMTPDSVKHCHSD